MYHKRQVEEVIHRELAYVFQCYIHDPRLQNITVTMVSLTKKLDYADIKITQLNARHTQKEIMEVLQKASHKIRYHLAQCTHVRRIPQLRFHYDISLEEGAHLPQFITETIDLH